MSCARAEIVAGAIALGEAREDERHAYRAHLAHCSHCVNALGGEREIERTIGAVASARDSERWEPDLRRRLVRATQSSPRLRRFTLGATAAVAVLAVVLLQRHPAIPHKTALPAPVTASQQSAAIAALGTENMPAFQHQAESLQFRSGATLTLRVVLDGHGKPVRCSVLHGAQRSLDSAFCAAVMRSRL
jgi:anti-sigma factor RsiW